jgi:hypothetical protein
MLSIVMSSRDRLGGWLDKTVLTIFSILITEVSAFSNIICIANDGTFKHESALTHEKQISIILNIILNIQVIYV